MGQRYYKKITAKHNLFDLKLKEVWQYRDLIVLFTKRNFITRYKQTVLGPAWLFLNPLVSCLIYCFIFGGIAGMSTGDVPQMLFYMTGNALWAYFSSGVTRNATTFTANASIYGKVYFPRLTTAISNILTSAIEMAFQMILVMIFLLFYLVKGTVHPHWLAWFAIPFVLIELGLMSMGVGIIISSITTKYRDLAILVTFAVQLWMYITPVVYPLSQAKAVWTRRLLLINPVTAPAEVFRYAVIGSGEILPMNLLWSAAFTLLVSLVGVVVFNKVERNFMDTV